MNVYTYSEARQKLARLLDEVQRNGKVLIRRKDGSLFQVTLEQPTHSPLHVKGIDTDITTDEIVAFVRESRKR